MIPFYKAQGLGNDFVIFLDVNIPYDKKDFSKKIADRRYGVGCDQVIFIESEESVNISFFNADGSEAESCGNGTRCAALLYMKEKNLSKIQFKSLGGYLDCQKIGEQDVEVKLKKPIIKGDVDLYPRDVFFKPGVHVDVGNPHLVILDPVEDFLAFGKDLENHPHFPERTNVGFATVLDSQNIKLNVWERGSGPTLACGSGACAAAIAAVYKGFCTQTLFVHQPGGILHIQIYDDYLTQTGHAEIVFKGTLFA